MARATNPRKRQRGSIDELPSGALRVRVYAGTDRGRARRLGRRRGRLIIDYVARTLTVQPEVVDALYCTTMPTLGDEASLAALVGEGDAS